MQVLSGLHPGVLMRRSCWSPQLCLGHNWELLMVMKGTTGKSPLASAMLVDSMPMSRPCADSSHA